MFPEENVVKQDQADRCYDLALRTSQLYETHSQNLLTTLYANRASSSSSSNGNRLFSIPLELLEVIVAMCIASPDHVIDINIYTSSRYDLRRIVTVQRNGRLESRYVMLQRPALLRTCKYFRYTMTGTYYLQGRFKQSFDLLLYYPYYLLLFNLYSKIKQPYDLLLRDLEITFVTYRHITLQSLISFTRLFIEVATF